LSRASVVISDGISTSLFYATSLGIEIEISDHDAAMPWLAKYDAQLRDVFPEFYKSHSREIRRDVAMGELGHADMKSATDLAELLSLDSSVSFSAGTAYWCYSPIRKVIQVLGSESSSESSLVDSHWTDWLKRPLENLPRRLPALKNTNVKRHFSA